MKPRVYLMVFLLIVPLQASLLEPLTHVGIRPDLSLAVLYVIGLLTSPVEAALAGMALGLIQDMSSASLLGLSGITRGLTGLLIGLFGRQVLDISSPSNLLFLMAFSLAEAIVNAIFLQALYGSVPFFSLLFTRMLPQAIFTGLLGLLLLRLINTKKALGFLKRRALQGEA